MASVWDAITGGAGEDTAAANRAAADLAFRQSQNIGQQYQTGALGQIGQGLTSAVGALGTGLTGQLDAYNKALAGSIPAGEAGVAAYKPLSQLGDTYGTAVKAYMDALGLGGKDAQAASFANYTQSPGVQFGIDQATKAAANKAASLGIAGSGNTLDAISEIARGRTLQDYNTQYLDRLAGFVNPQLAATTGAAQGIAGANRTLADIYQSGYAPIGAAYGANAGALAGLYSGAGESGANILGNVAGIQGQGARDLAAGTTAANNLELQSAQSAAKFWGDLAGSAIGAATTAYNPLGKLGSLYKTAGTTGGTTGAIYQG